MIIRPPIELYSDMASSKLRIKRFSSRGFEIYLNTWKRIASSRYSGKEVTIIIIAAAFQTWNMSF